MNFALRPGERSAIGARCSNLRGGKVIATDQDGRPALVAHAFGKGKVLTCAYPIEKYLSRVPAAFDEGDNTHRLYRALAEWAGVQPLFRSDRAEVEAAALAGSGRGYHRAHQPQRRATDRDNHAAQGAPPSATGQDRGRRASRPP